MSDHPTFPLAPRIAGTAADLPPVDAATSRRDLLRLGWRVGGALLAGTAAWTTVEALRPLATGDAGGELPVGPATAFAEGTATYVGAGRLYVTRARGRLFALAQQCPHLGCRVPFCEGSGRFACPCHGSAFDVAGEWLSGPSPRGMDRYAVREANGQVVVDLRTLAEGPPHGTQDYLTPARDDGACTSAG